MRELQFFIDLEKTKGKGKGDRNEGALIYNNASITIGDYEIKNSEYKHLAINSPDIVNMPVLCLYTIQLKLFKEIESTEEYAKLKLKIPTEELEYMEKEFGNNLFLINAREFINRVEKACKIEDNFLKHKLVKYYNYSSDNPERIKASKDIFNTDIAFMKDNSFKAQHEYRFLLSNVDMKEDKFGYYYELEIGDIRDIVKKIRIEDLDNCKMNIILNNNKS